MKIEKSSGCVFAELARGLRLRLADNLLWLAFKIAPKGPERMALMEAVFHYNQHAIRAIDEQEAKERPANSNAPI